MFSLSYEPVRDDPLIFWLDPELPHAYARRVATTPSHEGLYEVHLGYIRGYDRELPGLYRVVGSSLVRYAAPEVLHVLEAEVKPQAIEHELRRLEEFAYVPDKVSELGTAEMLDEDLVLMQANFVRFQDPYALALLDIDHLQELTAVGENGSSEAVNLIAATVAAQARSGDSAYSLGGDAFAVIYPFQHESQAAGAAERMRREVEQLAIPDPRSPAGVLTVSIGVSAARPHQSETTLAEAEFALRKAKALGCNRVCLFDQPSAERLAA